MLITLDVTSDDPLYRQLRDAITDAIGDGQFSRGELLPSSRGLAVELGISRNTVNAAYQELVAEGFLDAVPRRGYRVNPELRAHIASPPPAPAHVRVDWHDRLTPFSVDLGTVWKPPDWHRYPYPFVTGQPDYSAFPDRAWNRALKEASSGPNRGPSLRDSIDQDDDLLVDMVTRRILPLRGIIASPDQVLVTLGSQHGISLLAETLLDEHSTVGVEEPGYPDARQIFSRRGAQLQPLPVDESGLVTDGSALAGLDLVFVTPSHHYPTNVTMGVGRRHSLLTEAAQRDIVIVEDDYDSEFRYVGAPTQALKAMDHEGRVVYVGSFSKFLAPGLRLGYLVGDAALIAHLRERRRYAIRHPPGVIQRAVALMIEHGDYQRALRRSRKLLKAKFERVVESAANHLHHPPGPTGGLSLWIEGPVGIDATKLAVEALRSGIVIEPGASTFLARPTPTHFYRLGFSAIGVDSIDDGVALLAATIHAMESAT